MNAPVPMLEVTGIRLAQPDGWRHHEVVPAGLTIEQIVLKVLPGSTELTLTRVRVSLVRDGHVELIHPQVWRLARPRPGTQIVVALAPGKELKSILSVLVTIAAAAIGQFWLGPLLAETFGVGILSAAQWASVASLGLTALGGLLINALLPMDRPDGNKEKPAFAISGWKNELRPDAPVPNAFGKLRYAPPFGAYSWTEVVGDVLYTRAIFNLGYGPLKISDLKLGDTSLDDYDEFEVETREGRPGDEPLTIYTSQVIEQTQGVDLVRPRPRDDAGELIEGGTPESKPITRVTASDASGCCVVLSFPAGLIYISREGDKKRYSITIKRKFRLLGATDWTELDDVVISAKKEVGFFRAIRWDFPARGRYEIQLENMTPEGWKGPTIVEKCTWAVLQSFRPEYPLNFAKPLALVALRVKATYQINGQLDNFNCIVSRETRDWNGASWVAAETSNPASLAIHSLQGPGNTFPATDSEIDWQAFQDWHEFCTAKGLTYNRVHDFDATLADEIKAIGTAGRAAIRHNGKRWTVIIDRPRAKVIEHINARNASQIKLSSKYGDLPDAWRIQFLDQTNDFEPAERLVPRPGLEGPIRLTEQLDMPGVTDPDQIFLAGIRRWYEILKRATMWSAIQQGSARVATMGDQVMLSRDIISTTVASARVKAVSGNYVELDDAVLIESGKSYAIRFRKFTAADTIGESIVIPIVTEQGECFTVLLAGDGSAKPSAGDLVHFGPAQEDSIALIVAGIERGQNNATILNMLPAAPEIDALTDATPVPMWDGRIGTVVGTGNIKPQPPAVVGIATGISGTGDPNGLEVYLIPGPGAATVASYKVQYRLSGSSTWLGPAVADVAAGHVAIPGFVSEDEVEFQPMAVSTQGLESDWGPTVIAKIEVDMTPAAMNEDSIEVTGKLGQTEITIAMGPDAATTQIKVYRDGTALPNPIPSSPNRTVGQIDGDSTRVTKVVNGGFADASGWSVGTGWTIAAGKATKTAGVAADLSQAISMTAGKVYRGCATVSGRTAGTVTPKLTGGATVSGSSVSADGQFLFRLTAGTVPANLVFSADSSFDGSIDEVVLFEETAACISQGGHTYKFEPLDDDEVAGPQTSDFAVTVI